MTIDEIKELIRVVQETGIAELEYQSGDNRVRIKSSTAPPSEITITGPLVPGTLAPDKKIHELAGSSGDEMNEIVKSPIVGTYYDSPAPGAGPFVKVGERVEPKQVLCIIESMKLMNEIESEIAGIVVTKHIENGRPVEYGEALFTIRPL
jgi:acetyl-CoA carboxylase biotin carboxyl carrier protein